MQDRSRNSFYQLKPQDKKVFVRLETDEFSVNLTNNDWDFSGFNDWQPFKTIQCKSVKGLTLLMNHFSFLNLVTFLYFTFFWTFLFPDVLNLDLRWIMNASPSLELLVTQIESCFLIGWTEIVDQSGAFPQSITWIYLR